MSIAIYFRTLFRGRRVGRDAYGNRYYEDRKAKRYGKPRRWVIYKGLTEASKVPAEWHGWLHYIEPVVPNFPERHPWGKDHLPNLTGTPYAHKPKSFRGIEVSKDYEAWRPER